MPSPSTKLPNIGLILSTSLHSAKYAFHAVATVLLPYTVLLILFNIVLVFLSASPLQDILSITVFVLIFMYALYMGIVLVRIGAQSLQHKHIDLAAAHKGVLHIIGPLLVVWIIVALITGLGFLFLIVPGIILSLLYFSAKFLVILDGKSVHEALTTSVLLSKGRKWDLFVKLLIPMSIVSFCNYVALTIVALTFTLIGSAVSEEIVPLLIPLAIYFVSVFFLPVLINIPTYLYQELKKGHKI